MKYFDTLTKIYKKLQEKSLSVYIETDNTNRHNVTTKDHHVTIHSFLSREDAVKFCKFLDLNIIAFIKHK